MKFFFILIIALLSSGLSALAQSPFSGSSPKPVRPETEVTITPNPFRYEASVRFILLRDAKVMLSLYNILGQEALRIVDNWDYNPGDHVVKIKEEKLAAGVYEVRLVLDGQKMGWTYVLVLWK